MKVKWVGLVMALWLFSSHDMFLKLDSYFLSPNQEATIKLFNGTFDRSENTIDRDRMLDVTLVAPQGDENPSAKAWTEQGEETHLNVRVGSTGTYVAGVSTKARSIDLEAEAFNDYLQHDGILDVLEHRKTNGLLDQDARELYAKHVKTIFQVGDEKSDAFKKALHYPIEFIPLSNPYEAKVGQTLSFILLRDGMPLHDQLVFVGQSHNDDHKHEAGENHDHRAHEKSIRTDKDGLLAFKFDKPGPWYLRTIHMIEHTDQDIQYESCWGTLTFAIP